MYRDLQAQNHTWVLMSAAIIAALVFLFPIDTHAAKIPESITFSTGDFSHTLSGDILHDWFDFRLVTVLHPVAKKEIEHPSLCPLEKIFCAAFLPRHQRIHVVTERQPVLKEDAARNVLTELAAEIHREPLNAKLGVLDGQVVIVQNATPGRTLVVDETLTSLANAISTNIKDDHLVLTIATQITEPVITQETIASLGVTELIAEGKTNFRGSPKNRVFNIHRAIEQFDGVIIGIGEEFSFVKHLGEVDGEHGYLPELVIKNNKTEPEFGGGICQVSTTAFRAALNAGLKITARRNHAYPVQYYKPYGMDATIYIPAPDLRFKNNTPGSIIMFPTINGTELTFSFFGTKDNRTVTLDGPHILERNPDGSMRTIFSQTVKDASGTILIEDSFPSNYKSPSLFPHPGEEPVYTKKPDGWSEKQWKEYKKIRPS